MTEEVKKEEAMEENSKKSPYNAKVLDAWYTPVTEFKKGTYILSLPSIPLNSFNEKINAFTNANIDINAKEYSDWRDVVQNSIEYYTPLSLYQNRFSDEKSLFMQGVEVDENQRLSINNIKFKKTEGELKGEIALLKVTKLLGLGDVFSVPLPHSGIWVTIKPPTEKDLIDFYNTLFREKIVLGRATSGLTLTNFSVYINNRLIDFILKHIYSVNYSDIPKEKLKDYILIHDLPILAWGFACTIYPNGFEYQRACVNDIENCTYITKGIINLIKLLWIDNFALTEAQKKIFSEYRPNKLTVESYKKYIAEHSKVASSFITLKNDIKIKLRVPTLSEYISDGMNWINMINNSVESVIFNNENSEEEKEALLNQYIRSSILRQFSHFVDYIEVDENPITDRDTINQVLEAFSIDDEIREELTNKILAFKSDTTIALIGIPEYKCPNCQKEQNEDPINERFSNVIPLDVMNVFFTLLVSRIAKILERSI